MVNDVKSNGEMLLVVDGERELRNALAVFRDPGTGGSERVESWYNEYP